MATFVTTIKFTPQGLLNIQDTTKRAGALKASAKKLGAKITEIFWMMGALDGLLIFEAPDDETASALMHHIGSQGNVRTQTSRAFRAPEMEKILERKAK